MKQKRLRRVPAGQWAWFAEQTGALLRCGVPLREALQMLGRSRGFSSGTVRRLLAHLERGASFSQSLEREGFTPLFVALIRAAEGYGGYVEALQELARHYRQQAELTARLRQASIYPLTVLLLSVAALFFILLFILPQFALLYETLQVELPAWTAFLLRFHQWIVWDGLWLLALALAAVPAALAAARTGAGLQIQQRILYRLPIVGRWLKLRNSHYLVQQLALMLKNGVPFHAAWEAMTSACPWSSLRHVLAEMLRTLERGQLFSQSLMHYRRFFDPMLPELLLIAEGTGLLADTLALLRERYEESIVRENRWLVKVFEPLLIVLVGGVMALLMVSLLVPMFHLAAG